MAFKKPSQQTSVPDSPDKLFGDLPRRKHPSLFDHQGQVLRAYAGAAQSASDVAIQLPTGSGKTLVGLLLAEWRRRKYQEKVVYLCPTRQLARQVAEEAATKYGISVEVFVGSARGYSASAKAAYSDVHKVAVTTYNSLFNVNPFFDDPDVVILDDAHAAENYVASHWTVRLTRFEESDLPAFSAAASVLKGVLTPQGYARLVGDAKTFQDVAWVDKVPLPELSSIAEELSDAISAHIGNSGSRYAWSLLEDHLEGCHLYVAASEILIRPLIAPTWTHGPFSKARQRIFMSATLGAGGDLERLTGRPNITRLAIPVGWDRQGIGRRLFMFPEKSLDAKSTKSMQIELMRRAGRSLVLVPSMDEADEVRDRVTRSLGFSVYSGADLEEGRSQFVGKSHAVAIVANRYDGIDFPGDDCRLLFVEGLPRTVNLQERFLMSRMGSSVLFDDRVQTRVLQAVGRCTRGLNDYSVVVVTGEELSVYLADRKRRKYFHPELQAELEFGVEQSTEVKADDFLENFDLFIEHDAEWEEANAGLLELRDRATRDEFPAMEQLRGSVSHEIAWQKAMWNGDYQLAFDAAREVLGHLSDPALRGYRAWWHYLAGCAAKLEARRSGSMALESQAGGQFSSAKSAAPGIPWLIALSRREIESPSRGDVDSGLVMAQVERLETYLRGLGTLHNRAFSAREAEIRDGLKGRSFEAAQVLLGEHLGLESGKEERDGSPDPWWRIDARILVFEDYVNAQPHAAIDTKKARQASSHPDWIREKLPGARDAEVQVVLVTPVKFAHEGAFPHLSKVCYWALDEFVEWSERALGAIREIRRNLGPEADLEWRAQAAQILEAAGADLPGLMTRLSGRSARGLLRPLAKEKGC